MSYCLLRPSSIVRVISFFLIKSSLINTSQLFFYFFLGLYEHVYHQGSSSQYIADYNSNFDFFILGLGEIYDEILLEKKDFLTGEYVRSDAQMLNGYSSNFYVVHIGTYSNCRCAETGQHRFKVRTNGVNISYYDFPTLRLRGE